MKRTIWPFLVVVLTLSLVRGSAQTPAPQAPVSLSPATAEVVKLAQAGTSEDVILAYVQNSSSPFNLSADQILYLKDIGLSSQVTSAMLNRDNAFRSQPQPMTAVAPSPIAPPPPEPTTAPPPTTAAAPAYVSSPPADVAYFYNDLAPYGSWVSLPDYGWCWQPTVVAINRGWQPYCNGGHWVYTDAGWFWVSDYSWGWAPFHYGRWYSHPRCGWVWMPDRVWGPAWVTWRSAGSYCGWAPLPPHANFAVGLGWTFNGVSVGLNFGFGLQANHYTFIPMKDFQQRDFSHYRLPPAEVTRVYNQTTVINNYVVNNKTIVNQGIQVDRVAAATHTQIRKATLRDLPAGSPGPAHFQGSDRTTLMVYRPQLKAPARSANMVAQKFDERHPAIQHAEIAPVKAGSPSVAGTPGYPAPKTSGPAATHSTPGYRPGAPTSSYPSRTTSQSQLTAGGSSSQGYSPHTYYPKTYHQAADIHSLPPLYPREQTDSSRSDKGSGSHSKEK